MRPLRVHYVSIACPLRICYMEFPLVQNFVTDFVSCSLSREPRISHENTWDFLGNHRLSQNYSDDVSKRFIFSLLCFFLFFLIFLLFVFANRLASRARERGLLGVRSVTDVGRVIDRSYYYNISTTAVRAKSSFDHKRTLAHFTTSKRERKHHHRPSFIATHLILSITSSPSSSIRGKSSSRSSSRSRSILVLAGIRTSVVHVPWSIT